MLFHVNPKGSLPTKSPEKRSSPLKLELNACQESSQNFYIGTNNIQHLGRELLSSNFQSVFLHGWLKCLDVWIFLGEAIIGHYWTGHNFSTSILLEPLSHCPQSQVYESILGANYLLIRWLSMTRGRGSSLLYNSTLLAPPYPLWRPRGTPIRGHE